MGDVVGVLLVPFDGDPRGLLKVGPCGARPPTVELRVCRDGHDEYGRWLSGGPAVACQHPDHTRLRPLLIGSYCRGLVLAWDGDEVVEGLDRLDRAWLRPAGRIPGWGRCGGSVAPDCIPAQLARCWVSAWLARESHLGHMVLVDAEGREVTGG